MSLDPTAATLTKRVDLHCHSCASNKPAEATLGAIGCPECYSAPMEVYRQAKARGMAFVTLTDHDALEGVEEIAHLSDVLVGEELTCWFPEDQCKLHVLVYGISRRQHETLHSLATDIYDLAKFIEREQIAHSVAHPLYRQNDKLERWHMERLLLLFKGFECLNGAHSPIHRDSFEPVLESLSPAAVQRLSEKHNLPARWPEPWKKTRTAGSDDHGLLNIGRTWTEFPASVQTPADVLRCLREGNCQPSGEAGSSAKLAHTFYSVAVRYYGRHLLEPSGGKPNLAATLLQTFVGERRAPKKTELVAHVLRSKVRKFSRAIVRPFARPTTDAKNPNNATTLLQRLFLTSARNRIAEQPSIREVLAKGLPPLGEHKEMFDFVSGVNRDVSRGIADAIAASIDKASFAGLFEGISAIAAQQFVLSPYYFSLFHQNKERHLLREITGRTEAKRDIKVALFTDTLDDTNGVARFIRDISARAHTRGLQLHVHTSSNDVKFDVPGRRNFEPLLTRKMPYYEHLPLNLPPALEVMEWADRQQFDAVHISTPGPMGLCGWIVAKMLRVPILGTYHTDFPAYVDRLTNDHRVTSGTIAYMKWMYGQMACVLSRSRSCCFNVQDLGVADERIQLLPAGINTDIFNADTRDTSVWTALGVDKPKRLLYVGRVSVEKNLPLLVDAFKRLCETRNDTALVVAGDGPYLDRMKRELAGLPATFLGFCNDKQLVPLYSAADLFVFPSRTDTLGQVVMEAQACGLPVIVSNEGGPKESIDDGYSGVVMSSDDATRWCATIDELLSDDSRRQSMSRAAVNRASRFSLDATLDAFWTVHERAVTRAANAHPDVASDLPHAARVARA
jgi:glycosyltransferase involved in cell wall biosynthesis